MSRDVQMNSGVFDQYKLIGGDRVLNLTIDHDQITVTGSPVRRLSTVRDYGLVLAAERPTTPSSRTRERPTATWYRP